jgi:hypothetical protein
MPAAGHPVAPSNTLDAGGFPPCAGHPPDLFTQAGPLFVVVNS